jgi:hypothetical protein
MMSGVSFTLEVRITGICLFVPEPKANPPRVTVLMPQTDGSLADDQHHGHEHRQLQSTIDVHRSVLIYETKFGGPCDDTTSKWCLHELAGLELTLANGSAPHVSVPGVYQLHRAGCNRKATPNARNAEGVAAKVILGSGYCERVPPGARFLVDKAITRMAYEVRWVIPDVENSELILQDLITGSDVKTIHLRVNQDDRVVLYVRCVPESEIWPDSTISAPNKKMLIPHFFALDRLLVPGHFPVSIPQWQNEPGDHPFDSTGGRMETNERRGNPYTCMPGQTEPGP